MNAQKQLSEYKRMIDVNQKVQCDYNQKHLTLNFGVLDVNNLTQRCLTHSSHVANDCSNISSSTFSK